MYLCGPQRDVRIPRIGRFMEINTIQHLPNALILAGVRFVQIPSVKRLPEGANGRRHENLHDAVVGIRQCGPKHLVSHVAE